MNIYQKLNQAREQFHESKLTKTGHNKFAGYNYFELGDFLVPALKILANNNLCAIVSFDKDIAKMTIIDIEKPDSTIVLTSPMGSAALKGCHEVQNIGAVETYQRRYLWVAALEIVEHDALDSSTGSDKPNNVIPATPPTSDLNIPPARLKILDNVANAVVDLFNADDIISAYEEYVGIEDGDEKIALWKLLPSNIRSSLKKHSDSIKQQPKA
jgi:hypothetical protein